MRKTLTSKRSGWTLLEMALVLPLMALLLSASVMLLTTLFRSQQSLRDDLHEQSTRARLGVQLRTDAHAAMSAKCESPSLCEFSLSSGEAVHYQIKETALHREVRREGAVLEREQYPLANSRAAFSLDEARELPLVRLAIQADEELRKYASAGRSATLEGAVGTLYRQRGRSAAP